MHNKMPLYAGAAVRRADLFSSCSIRSLSAFWISLLRCEDRNSRVNSDTRTSKRSVDVFALKIFKKRIGFQKRIVETNLCVL